MRNKFREMFGATEEQLQKLDRMYEFMLDYNKKVNLTRITAMNDVWEKHFIDSGLPLLDTESPQNVPRGTFSVADVGSGAGFPGAVWEILRPNLQITLIDSLQKRVFYLNLLKQELGLNYTAIHGRGEEIARKPPYNSGFSVVVSRAVAGLPELVKFCLPLVKKGGDFLAMKGANGESEIAGAKTEIAKQGCGITEVKNYALPGGDKRCLIRITKNL
jgi:16S rRNA (guanine527-N7)-methyltransferase